MTKTWKLVAGTAVGLALMAGAGVAVTAAREQEPRAPGGFMGQPGPGGRGMRGPGGPGGIVPGLRALDLTDAQREQLKATMESHKAEFEAQAAKMGPARQALHARRLGFIHPDGDRPMSFEAELPTDLADLLSRLRRRT